MTIDPRIAALVPDLKTLRHDLHSNPEILYELDRTSSVVAAKLRDMGCDEVVTGVGRTGVVAVINGKTPGRAIGLRADMDALPIEELTNLPYRSTTPGKMHACGHDGHTTMLMGAARHLAANRDFAGSVVLIFQPAEEGGYGARTMIEDGLFDRWTIDEVYGLHNEPGRDAGTVAVNPGPMLAGGDMFTIDIQGLGTHAAMPHLGIDPIYIGSQIVNGLQSIASRTVNPLRSVVVSVTIFQAGTASNIIPEAAHIAGTIRTLTNETRELAEDRFHQIVKSTAEMHGATVRVNYQRGYPPTVNHAANAGFVRDIAKRLIGDSNVTTTDPMMAAEDFSYMLQQRPGAYFFLGNGASASLHHPAYDFNDEIIPVGVQMFVNIVHERGAATA